MPCESCGAPKQPASGRCSKCADQRGYLNPRWRGGKARHSNGYTLVSAPGHPRVEGRRDHYVMEHVLVMEETLGRYLLPGENVHHLNGVKGDNRPENLELWVKSQPSGIRARDALEWAKEIVRRYDGLEGI